MLGDPVSLKAEVSDTSPTEHDLGAASEAASEDGLKGAGAGAGASARSAGTMKQQKSLKEAAKENPTMLGDPVSLKAETSDTEPTENDRGAASNARPEDAPAEKSVRSKI